MYYTINSENRHNNDKDVNKINFNNNTTWNQIKYQSQQPSKRWGHKTIMIDNEIILLGGFSDTSYLNDLWVYNIHTNKWKQLLTYGQLPQKKSNFTMNYNRQNNSIIVFGGGGIMKKRYNTINILDWSTKIWKQYTFQNQQAPWERTYHTAEFKYPFLFVFAGEGSANINFDDLWVFNVQNKLWKCIQINQEIQYITKNNNTNNTNNNTIFHNNTNNNSISHNNTNNNSISHNNTNNNTIFHNNTNNNSISHKKFGIQARRFHCSSLIDYQLFIISGCKTNYQCLANIYSMNLLPFFISNGYHNNCINISNEYNNNSINNTDVYRQQKLHWKQYILSSKQTSLIQRWGHTVEVYQNKIYIFGGRNKQDLNDIVVFDPQKVQLKKVQMDMNNHTNYATINNTINTTLFNTHHNNKNIKNIPKSRRRHSSCMIGSSMIIFGGFNIEYFNDMHYISLFTLKQSVNKLNSINNIDKQGNNHQQEQSQIIKLSQESYEHFMIQTRKSKLQYNIQLVFIIDQDNKKSKQTYKIGSISQQLIKQSKYFKSLFQFSINQLDTAQKQVQLFLPQHISLQVMIIFNTFMIKGILILKQDDLLNQLQLLSMLLQCSDYYIVNKLKYHIQKILINKVLFINNNVNIRKNNNINNNISSTILINIIYSIGGYYHLQQLLNLCSSLIVLTQSYYLYQYNHNYKYNNNTILNSILVNKKTNLIKQKYIQKLLIQTQFDQLQKSKQSRSKHKHINYKQNIKEYNIIKISLQEQNSLDEDKQNNHKRPSILNKVINSINKIYQKQNNLKKQNIFQINQNNHNNNNNTNSLTNKPKSNNRLQFNNISNLDINS